MSKFNLPLSLVEAIPHIGDHDTAVLMHNDGVAQGLSEVPFMQDVDHWGVLTIGTGLGNARFTNRFNLPASLVEAIPQIGDHDTAVLMHNDGVVQGLSEVLQDVEHWGVLTIGTGLGNARFTNRRKENGKDEKKAKKGKD